MWIKKQNTPTNLTEEAFIFIYAEKNPTISFNFRPVSALSVQYLPAAVLTTL